MTRILAFIENDMYVRNFITSGAFDLLFQEEGFALAVSNLISTLRESVPANRVIGMYQRSEKNRMVTWNYNKLSMFALRKKSRTFEIKVEKELFGKYHTQDQLVFLPQGRDLIPFINAMGTYSEKYSLIDHPEYFSLLRQSLLQQFEPNASVERLIAYFKAGIVLFPVTGVESTGTELVFLSKKYGFKTYFLINGWDNLSSKGAFPLLPDFMGLWGPQSQNDACQIHGMRPHQCILLGCSRYEVYFDSTMSNELLFPHKYILFAGATIPNDEITPLKIMDEVLEDLQIHDIQVVYRPHPWRDKRNCYDLFEKDQYKHTIMDPQVEDDYYQNKRDNKESPSVLHFPELKYYPSLVNHSQFIVSPMSSMILEAGLFDVPALVLAHDDGYHAIPGNLISQFCHFEGCQQVPGWFFANRLPEIQSLFRWMVTRFKDDTVDQRPYRPVLSSAMQQYHYHDERSYAKRLLDSINLIHAQNQHDEMLKSIHT